MSNEDLATAMELPRYELMEQLTVIQFLTEEAAAHPRAQTPEWKAQFDLSLEILKNTITLFKRNPGEVSEWPLAQRLELLALTMMDCERLNDQPFPVEDVKKAVALIRDYERFMAATVEVYDDRLGAVDASS